MNAAAVIVAAGAGRRFGGRRPKQFLLLAGKPLLYWSLRAFERTPTVRSIVLVVAPDFIKWAVSFLSRSKGRKPVTVVAGGRERSDSVRNGILACGASADVILIHDAARPLVTPGVISRVAKAARRTGAALAAWPVPDTIKESRGKRVRRTVPRDGLWLAQTPQGFRRDVAVRLFRRPTRALTDDVQWAERAGVPVELVSASPMNFKVTLPEDFVLCRRLLA